MGLSLSASLQDVQVFALPSLLVRFGQSCDLAVDLATLLVHLDFGYDLAGRVVNVFHVPTGESAARAPPDLAKLRLPPDSLDAATTRHSTRSPKAVGHRRQAAMS